MMNKRFFLYVISALFLGSAASMGVFAQESTVSDGPGPNIVIEIATAGGEEVKGVIVIDLYQDLAPQHVARIIELAEKGLYDGVVFHRVIDGFMAQTGDVRFGREGQDLSRAGTGGADMPDLPAEFSNVSFERGVVGMARSSNPNSANSQFFIMFSPAPHLNGQYTVVGRVIEGMEIVDNIKRGFGRNGEVQSPDVMSKVTVVK